MPLKILPPPPRSADPGDRGGRRDPRECEDSSLAVGDEIGAARQGECRQPERKGYRRLVVPVPARLAVCILRLAPLCSCCKAGKWTEGFAGISRQSGQ